MNSYQQRKEATRQKAIAWQAEFSEHNYTYEEIVEAVCYFIRIGRKYGLLKEFKENGIC